MSGTVNQDWVDLELPPAAADLPFSFTTPASAVPYLLEWFNDNKRPGEQPDEFLLRVLINDALNHRRNKLESDGEGEGFGSGDGLHAEQRAAVSVNYTADLGRIINELEAAAIAVTP